MVDLGTLFVEEEKLTYCSSKTPSGFFISPDSWD